MGILTGVLSKYGAWINYGEQRLGQGRENAKLFLRDNPATAREIEQALRQNAGLIAERFLENTGGDNFEDDAGAAEL